MARRLLVASSFAAIAAVAASCLWLYWTLWRPQPNPERLLIIDAGSSGRSILEQLGREGLAPSLLAGRLYLALWGGERELHFGHYRIAAGSRPVDVLERLLDGRVETVTVTVREGSDLATAAAQLSDAGFGTLDEWRQLTSRGDLVHDLAPQAVSLEGVLFPDTYRFALGLSASAVAGHMVDRFREVWGGLVRVTPVQTTSVYEVVVLASLVEAETSIPEERKRVAGVFANRLRRGMLLQCDPTVIYALKARGEWQGRLLRRHLQVDHPYNTYRYPGLPPGPINSPGAASLAAALEPEQHGFLYFVARPAGGHTFSRTLNEHNLAVARLRQAGR